MVSVTAVLSAMYVLWIRADTGYADDFVRGLEHLCHDNSHLVNLCMGASAPAATSRFHAACAASIPALRRSE